MRLTGIIAIDVVTRNTLSTTSSPIHLPIFLDLALLSFSYLIFTCLKLCLIYILVLCGPHLVAPYNVFAMYPFVPLTQYRVKRIMKMNVFLFSKFICLPFFFQLFKFPTEFDGEANFPMLFRC